MHSLQKHVLQKWSAHMPGHFSFEVGLSGGIDSVVLLHILHTIFLNKDINLTAVHINHEISPNANLWEEFCKSLCNSFSIPLRTSRHKIIKSGGESLENNARRVRYDEFFKGESPLIVLAHHKNDQIETTLSQILRGSDLHNIASMMEISKKQDKLFWRPLLDVKKTDIKEYAKHYNLNYVDDESNLDHNYLRNFIRLRILPELLEFDPHIDTKILNLPEQLQEMFGLIDEIIDQDMATVLEDKSINLDKFKILSLSRQRQVIAQFLKQNNAPLPTSKQINEFIRQSIQSKWDSKPNILLNNEKNLVKYKNWIKLEEPIL